MMSIETIDNEKARDERDRSVEECPLCGGVGTFGETIQQVIQTIDDVVSEDVWKRIIEKMAKLAEDGDVEACRLLLEFRFGRPTQPIELSFVVSCPE